MLAETNGTLHAEMEERFFRLVETLTKLEFSDARDQFETLMAMIARHMAVEEEQVLPCFSEVGGENAAQDERLVLGDHVILCRTEETVRKRLNALADGDRREMVLALDDVLRFGRVLDHHTDREQKLLYPRLDAIASDEKVASLTEVLRTQTMDALPSVL